MMDMYKNITYLTLAGHIQLQKYRYLYFSISLALFIYVICSNTIVLYVICVHKSLHEPMYIFISALLVNAIIGSMALYPKLLTDLLSDQQIISYSACLLQSFVLYVYAATDFTLLTVMAFDRYVSICRPLQYHTVIRPQRVKLLLLLAWLVPATEVGCGGILTSRLKLCQFILARIVCDNYSLVKLSCGDIQVNNIYGLFMLVITIFPPVIFILFSYAKILMICLRGSQGFRRGALRTCLPHLIVFMNFAIIMMFELIQHRLPSDVPHIIRLIMSVVYVVIPPVFNPLIYGFKIQQISKHLKVLLCSGCKKINTDCRTSKPSSTKDKLFIFKIVKK